MTKEAFEAAYAQRSGITVDELHALGRYAVSCGCGDEACHGWQMVRKSYYLHDEALKIKLPVAVIWLENTAVRVLVDDRDAWRGSSGADIIDFLRQLEELDYITLREYDDDAEYLRVVRS